LEEDYVKMVKEAWKPFDESLRESIALRFFEMNLKISNNYQLVGLTIKY
jgi:hypothetical protein